MRPRIALNASLLPHGLEEGLAVTVKAAYADAVAQAGGMPLAVPLLEDPQALREAMADMHGLLMIGGNDISGERLGEPVSALAVVVHPRREQFDHDVLKIALEMDLPVLAICLGCQVLNVLRGGTLYQDLYAERPQSNFRHSRKSPAGFLAHDVTVLPGTLMARIAGEGVLPANSGHHQAVRRVGDGLIISAESPDGLPEAIEDPSREFVLGVQWHPEVLQDQPRHKALFESFVQAAARRC